MGHLNSIDLPERGARDSSAPRPAKAKSRWWLWIVILAVVAIGIWYYRGHSTSEAGATAAPGEPRCALARPRAREGVGQA